MDIKQTTEMYEVLVRFDESGKIKGAHKIEADYIFNGNELLSFKENGAKAISKEDAIAIIQQAEVVDQ